MVGDMALMSVDHPVRNQAVANGSQQTVRGWLLPVLVSLISAFCLWFLVFDYLLVENI